MTVRHDAKFSDSVVEVLRSILTDPIQPVEGPVFDPFAGLGLRLADLGRSDVSGCEIEPEWAGVSPLVSQGDALDPGSYPPDVGCVVTSPCYGNRFADQYLGPKCPTCEGSGIVPEFHGGGLTEWLGCQDCQGTGHDGHGRYGYAISLGRKVSEGSSASLQWGYAYRQFHRAWLRVCADVLPLGARRLVLNISDHHRAKRRQYVTQFFLEAAGLVGFSLVEAHTVDTPRFGHGQNQESKPEGEMVLVFDLATRAI